MKTRIDHTSWKRLMLGLTAFSFLLMGGIVSAAPNGGGLTVALPNVAMDTTVAISTVIVQPVTTTNIDPNLHLIGFQGDFTFDETVVSFVAPVVQAAGLTATGWTVSGNVLPLQPGQVPPERTLRVSAFVNDGLTPLSGAGTLYNLRMIRVSSTPPASTALTWKPDPDNFIFIDDNLAIVPPAQTNGSVTITGPTPTPGGPTPSPTQSPTPTPAGPTPTPGPLTVALPIANLDPSVPISTVVILPLTTTNISAGLHYIGFQGDFTFDETVATFSAPFVEPAGLTGSGWTVSANILPGPGPIRILRVSAFVNDGTTPLSGTGTLYNLRIVRVSNTPPTGTFLTWRPDPDNFQFFNDNLDAFAPAQTNGLITVCPAVGSCPTPTPPPTPTPSPTPSPSPTPTSTPTATASPSPTLTPGTPSPTPSPSPTTTPICPTLITQSTSQTITAGTSVSCNGGTPNFFHADNSYWRAFNMAPITGGAAYNVTSVDFGIEQATANPAVGNQPVTVRLHVQTAGTFPAGTRTEIATTTVNVTNQMATVLNVPISATVPAGTTQLIMEVFTPNGQAPVNNSFFIGSNTATQNGLSYISAATCGLNTPTDVSTIGFPNMHMVFNVRGGCGPTPTPGTPTPTQTPTSSCPPTLTQSTAQTITTGNSASCNGGSPNFFHADSSYWRAFNVSGFTVGTGYNVSSVSFGIEQATANPGVGTQPVIVRLHRQATGTFPAGTWTLLATTTVNISNQTGTVLNVPITAFVPVGTTQLIMEVNTPNGQNPANNSFFIGSNGAGQSAPSYISAGTCSLNTPTDVSTIGFPNMHMVFNVNGLCGPSPTPSASPTPSPTPTPTPPIVITPTPTATPLTPTPTPCVGCPTPTPCATCPTPTPGGPTPTPATQTINLSTRMRVDTGNGVAIGGFIITGSSSKRVIIRAIGPSLVDFGITDALADPILELHGENGFVTIVNNNWRDNQEQEIIDTGIAPTNDLESAIVGNLPPGSYTAVVKGAGSSNGVGLVEIYDLNPQDDSKLANLSTRAIVHTGNDIVIAGFLLSVGPEMDKIIVRGIGPSLADLFPGEMVLADPMLELRDSNGALLIANNNWADDPSQAALLIAAGLQPTNPAEAGLVAFLPSGGYTALLSGVNDTTGLSLVEIYDNPASSPTPTPGPTGTPGGPTPTPPIGPTPTPPIGPTPTPPIGPTASPTPTPGVTVCTENFDGVTAPALPAGWVASNPVAGDGVMFVTTTNVSDTAPNNAFIPDQDDISDKVLDRQMTINSASPVLTFRNNFNTEFSDGIFWDGGVLEISTPSISGGEFLDVTDSHVGGSFTSGGYTGEISGDASNPLAGRMAWSGNSGGYIDTVLNMGPNLNGQTVTLRFRFGTDEAEPGTGWHIDGLSINGASCP